MAGPPGPGGHRGFGSGAGGTGAAIDIAAVHRAERLVEKIRRHPWAEGAGRIGLGARGAIYCLVALLAVAIAVGRGGDDADRQGALRTVADKPFGKVVLVALAAGFACYAGWRLVKAAAGVGEGSGPRSGVVGAAKRLADLGRAGIYVTLVWSALKLVVGRPDDGGARSGEGTEKARALTARFMGEPAGRWIVIVAGAGLVVVGLVLAYRAVAQKFEKHLDDAAMSPWQRTWLPRLGTVGFTARGLVAVLVGTLVMAAGITFDPNKAVGIDGALRNLAGRPFGPLLLSLTAAGLAAFGLYSFVEARYRKILES